MVPVMWNVTLHCRVSGCHHVTLHCRVSGCHHVTLHCTVSGCHHVTLHCRVSDCHHMTLHCRVSGCHHVGGIYCRWRRYFPLKYWKPLAQQHSIKSQKTGNLNHSTAKSLNSHGSSHLYSWTWWVQDSWSEWRDKQASSWKGALGDADTRTRGPRLC